MQRTMITRTGVNLRHSVKYLAAVLAVLFVVAATPSDIVAEVAADGFYVDSGTSATDACVSASVADARNAGGNLYVVVLVDEPSGGATTFSGGMLTSLGTTGTVFTVAPETVGYEENEAFWSTDQLNAAVDESLTVASDNDVVRTFVNTLTGESGTCSNQSTEGKSGWAWIVVFIIIIGGIGFLIWRSARSGKQKRIEELAKAKEPVQAQIDAIANDILELETEVSEANNPEATAHFNNATASFTTASDRLAAANDAGALLALSFDLDLTIWTLDCAEAVLDGNPLPDEPQRPEPPKPPVSTSIESAPGPSEESERQRTDLPATLPEYRRRGGRQSSYGSDQMMQVLVGMAAMKGLGGLGGGVSGRPLSGGGSGSSRSGRSGWGSSKPPSGTQKKRTRGGGRRSG